MRLVASNGCAIMTLGLPAGGHILRWVLITLLGILSLPSAARCESHAPWTLESVLHELDIRAHNFKGFTADIERTKVTVVVNDKSTETGTIAVRGDKMRLEMTKPDSRTILRDGDDFYIYTPGLKRVEEYNLGGKRQMVDSFVLLGFGSSGKDLQSQYLLTFMGESPLDNHKAVKLELTPKSDDVRHRAFAATFVPDNCDQLLIERNPLRVKPFSAAIGIAVVACDVQSLNVARGVLAHAPMNLRLFADKNPLRRFV